MINSFQSIQNTTHFQQNCYSQSFQSTIKAGILPFHFYDLYPPKSPRRISINFKTLHLQKKTITPDRKRKTYALIKRGRGKAVALKERGRGNNQGNYTAAQRGTS